jgi:hypothetical protein
MSKEKDMFAKGIQQLRAEGFVPAQQQAVQATLAEKDDWMSKMALKWKHVSQVTEAKANGQSVPQIQQVQPRVQNAPSKPAAATMDLPSDIRMGDYGSQRIPNSLNEGVDPREDDEYFERMQQQKLQQTRRNIPQTTQSYQYTNPPSQPSQFNTTAPKYVLEQQQYSQPLNEQLLQQVAESVLKDVVLNLYIEEKIKKVLSEGLSDDRIAQVVKQTIKELRDGAAKKK